jgi:hypothetical protein
MLLHSRQAARRQDRRGIPPQVEGLEGRALLSMIHVNFNAAGRTVPAEFLGVSTPGYDHFLSAGQNTRGTTPDPGTVKLIRDAGLGVLRLSNGSRADDFHFANNQDKNLVGAGLWAQLAFASGTGAMVDVNFGTGTPQEAAAYLAYLNGTTDQHFAIGTDRNGRNWKTVAYWARLRGESPHPGGGPLNQLRVNHPDPYNFTRFEVGNEVYFANYSHPPKIEYRNGVPIPGALPALARKYAGFVTKFAHLAAQIDSAAQIGVGVAAPWHYRDLWNVPMLSRLKALGYTPNFISDHFYVFSGNDDGPPLSDADLLDAVTGSGSDTPPHFNSPRNLAQRAAAYRDLLTTEFGAAGNSVQLVMAEFNSDAASSTKQKTSLTNGLFLADAIGDALRVGYEEMIIWDLRNGYTTKHLLPSDNDYGWRTGADDGIVGTDTQGVGPPETGSTVPYPGYFAVQLASRVIHTGDMVEEADTSNPQLSAYAIRQADGQLGLLVINKSLTATDDATIDISGFVPDGSVTGLQYGLTEDTIQEHSSDGKSSPTPISTTRVVTPTGSGGQFQYAFAPYSMTEILLTPKAP